MESNTGRINIIDLDYNTFMPDWKVDDEPFYYRMFYIDGGQTVYQDDERSFPLLHNHLYIFPVNRHYTLTQNPDHPISHLWFKLSIRDYFITEPVDIDIKEHPICYHLLMAIKEVLIKLRKREKLDILVEFIIDYIQEYIQSYKITDQRILDATIKMQKEFLNHLTDQELADAVFLDKYYFIKLFKRVMGITPQKYIAMYKENYADNLLRQGLPVNKVAEMVGFADAKAFSRFYSAQKKMAPSKMKKVFFLQK